MLHVTHCEAPPDTYCSVTGVSAPVTMDSHLCTYPRRCDSPLGAYKRGFRTASAADSDQMRRVSRFRREGCYRTMETQAAHPIILSNFAALLSASL